MQTAARATVSFRHPAHVSKFPDDDEDDDDDGDEDDDEGGLFTSSKTENFNTREARRESTVVILTRAEMAVTVA